MSQLNPNATPFVPRSQYLADENVVVYDENSCSEAMYQCSSEQYIDSKQKQEQYLEVIPEDELEPITETNMSQAELDELEEVENWVDTMAWLEELEREHCIELALRLAPKQRVIQIEDKLGLWRCSKTPTKRRGRK
eukprot:TRINITY_DN7151_c0_g1_i1.p2 TRINITY_DN7151_c0_g1~~TRINITY_DN7151_c0_g1_i1.p2  ORF type:complete len:136 (-),score=16.34 TRINITY_DN7151_c0_g1_i1:301-708(-)